MDVMKDFEGIKRIQNNLNLSLEDLYKILVEYHKQIGEVSSEEDTIICNTNGKYCIEVKLKENQIILERKLDKDQAPEEAHKIGEKIKSVDMSIADRMIEQIYDFLLDYLNNGGIVKEYITGVKKVLYVSQSTTMLSDIFYIKDSDGKEVYEVKNNKLFKEYVIDNLILRRQDVKISYKKINDNQFEITKNPYTVIPVTKSRIDNKTTLVGTINNKLMKVTADYTDNHFIVEVNNIVIGAVDSLDAENKNRYRIEINDTEYEYLVIAANVIIDLYLENQYEEEEE